MEKVKFQSSFEELKFEAFLQKPPRKLEVHSWSEAQRKLVLPQPAPQPSRATHTSSSTFGISTRKYLPAGVAPPGSAYPREEPRDSVHLAQLPLPALQAPPQRERWWAGGGRELGNCTPRAGAPRATAMAMSCPLNRYLLLMAQEHLEFRLPVSPQRPPQLLDGRGRHGGGWCADGGDLSLNKPGSGGVCLSEVSRVPGPSGPGKDPSSAEGV